MAKLISGTRVYGNLIVDTNVTVGTSIILAGTTLSTVTGTGSTIVLSNSPTISGHPTIEGVTSTGATGTGKFVFDTSPTLITPTLGVATATSINKLTITAPTTAATLTLANNSTLATVGAFATTITSTTATSVTLPASGYLVSTSAAVTGTPGSTTFLRGDSTWSTALTNFQFTGGIITVATSTTTPALTIAGTSGGVPYFSSGTTWASSTALAAGSFVVGGGAGNAPYSILTGTGVVNAHGTAVNTTVTNSQTYSSGGAVSQNTVVLSAVTGLAIGQYVSGTGLAAGTYVTNISSNTVTVSNNFTVQAAGTYVFTGYGLVTQNSTLTANNILLGGGSGTGISSTTTGTGVVTALGIQTNTTNGMVTQTATLTANNILLGGGSGTGIASTATGTGVVTALGYQVNTNNGMVTQSGVLAANALLIGGGSGTAITSITTGTGVLTALGVNVGNDGSFLVQGGGLGTPSAITLTNATNLPISGIAGLGTGVATALANPATGTGNFVLDNAPIISLPSIDNIKLGYTTTVTSGGAATLTATSTAQQYFTGTSTHTVVLPSTATLALGESFLVVNNSTQNLQIQTSATFTVLSQTPNTAVRFTVVNTANNNIASWDYYFEGFDTALVDVGVINHVGYYASSTNQVSSAPYAVFSNSASQLQLGNTAYPGGGAGVVKLIGDAAGSVSVQASASGSASNWIMTLPPNAGTAGYVLGTDGNGTTSWVAGGSGGGGGGGGASVTVSSSAPSSPSVGNLWWNPTNATLSIYESTGTGWVNATGANQDWGLVSGVIYSYDDYGSVI